jgi:hypothetical protein
MTDKEFEADKSIPSWIREYRTPMERSRSRYHYHLEHLALTEAALLKYTSGGEARAFHGLSLVYFLDASSEAFSFLKDLSQQVRRDFEQASIAHKFAFLPEDTFHITVADIITRHDLALEKKITEAIQKSFNGLRQDTLQPPHFFFRRDPVVSAGTSVVVLADPKDYQSLVAVQRIREAVYRDIQALGEHISTQDPYQFIGHATITYIIQPLLEQTYATFKRVMQKYENTRLSSSDFAIDRIELRRFASMEDWGTAPLAELQLPSS